MDGATSKRVSSSLSVRGSLKDTPNILRVEIIVPWITFDSGLTLIRPKKFSDYHMFNGRINVQLIPKVIPAPISNQIMGIWFSDNFVE
jgi:hypothetical protein